ncbi:MAG: carboxypeptidase regulatory-like domain-containing protein [Acidobacteria bacterium]|nr:carboxypeptidase regulatory-like domain-containing protein [Acidobacteriota bacterium]
MKKQKWRLLFILVAMSIATSCVSRPLTLPAASKTLLYPAVEAPDLTGEVFREGSHELLTNVIVEVFSQGKDRSIRRGKTNDKGQFKFALPEGAYMLQFSLLGYDRVRQPVDVKRTAKMRLEIGLPLGT